MFTSRVLPGAALVRATRWRTSALIRLDLPTFDRPTNATSASPSDGRSRALAALRMKLASMFTGLDGLGRRDRLERYASSPAFLPIRPFLPSASVSDGVVDDRLDRLRLRRAGEAACARL